MIDLVDLKKICPLAKTERLNLFVDHLNTAMLEHSINNQEREAAFIAQLAHESGSFRYVEEIASGQAYEGRTDLGNTHAGDGVRFKGRGLIQITGRANYAKCGEALGIDLITEPELLEKPEWACKSAAWFWDMRGLNDLADKGDFLRITKRINGGTNGYQDRLTYWDRAKAALA